MNSRSTLQHENTVGGAVGRECNGCPFIDFHRNHDPERLQQMLDALEAIEQLFSSAPDLHIVSSNGLATMIRCVRALAV